MTVPNAGQSNYGAAKAAIAALTLVAADELQRYGVRANAIAPIARTRLTLATPGMGALMAAEAADAEAEGSFDAFSPANWPAGTTSKPLRPKKTGRIDDIAARLP